MWEMYRLKYHQDLNVVATQEGNFQRNRRHLNLEKESTETPNNGDTDKPMKTTPIRKRKVEWTKKTEGTKTTEFHVHV